MTSSLSDRISESEVLAAKFEVRADDLVCHQCRCVVPKRLSDASAHRVWHELLDGQMRAAEAHTHT